MGGVALTIVVGLASGVLSGAFGIGGGLLTTPAIRLLLGYPAIVAVGTPLPVIVPGALTGAFTYWRRGSADLKAGLIAGLVGSVGSVTGAWLSRLVGGTAIMIGTALLMGWASTDMLLQARTAARERAREGAAAAGGDAERDGATDGRCDADGEGLECGEADAGVVIEAPAHGRATPVRFALVGLAAGLYSGLLGLGGGFVVIPALTRFCGFPVKRAIGTSLLTISLLAIPGTLAHAALGHVVWPLAGLLALGVVPGALIGERIIRNVADRHVRIAFAIFLLLVGVWLAVSELAGVV